MKDNTNLSGDCQRLGKIYKITNLVNGKIYVGKTKRDVERRIYEHVRNSQTAKSGIDAAIRKYGWENFRVDVIEICTVENLDEREIFWIAELNSKAPNGYNLTDGGDGNSNLSVETRAKISANHADVSGEKNAFYGKHHTQEARTKMSVAKKGQTHKPHSKETREKISASNKGKHQYLRKTHLSAAHRSKISAARKAWWAKKKSLANGGDS